MRMQILAVQNQINCEKMKIVSQFSQYLFNECRNYIVFDSTQKK
jgi:hypothetical protein